MEQHVVISLDDDARCLVIIAFMAVFYLYVGLKNL